MNETIKSTSLFGVLIAFVAIFRNSEYMAFLDQYTYEDYYITQLLFVLLIISLVAHLLAKFAKGQMTLRELAQAGKDLSEIPELDKRTAKRRKGEVVFLTNLVTSKNFESGEPLIVENTLETIDYKQLAKEIRKSNIRQKVIVAGVLIFAILMLLFFDTLYPIFLRI